MTNQVTSKEILQRETKLREELDRIIPVMIERYDPEKILLFGSLVNDEVGEWSDLDVVVIKATDKRFLDRVAEVLDLLAPKVGMDVLVYTPEEFAELVESRPFFRQEIYEKSEVVYERAR